jgi:hypothetical protein
VGAALLGSQIIGLRRDDLPDQRRSPVWQRQNCLGDHSQIDETEVSY